MTRCKVWLNFPGDLSREVVEDRLHLLINGGLTLRDVDAVVDAWDTREVPFASEKEMAA